MDLDKHFDTAFAAPDGIKRLRELILTLAMQGKLVPQDPQDIPASELLKEIEAEKKRLVKEGEIKASKPLPEIDAEEVPYDLPDSWEWVQLGDITEIIRGITFPGSEKSKDPAPEKIACLRTTNVQSEIEWNDILYIDKKYMKKESQLICSNDIVMSMANSRELVGKVAIIKVCPHAESTFGGFLGVIRTYKVLPFFVLNLLKTNYARTTLIDSASQTTNIANVSIGKLNPFLVPLPPLAEQRRIVAKIDRLMARCDELEKLKLDRSQQRINIHTAALDRLFTAPDTDTFKESWNFITQHFGELYSVKANVTELRKAILQLAVMGKLVPQDPNDEPASELLKSIDLEKQRLVKEGKIKKSKPLPEIELEDIPYQLPKGWKWIRLNEVSLSSDAGWSPQCHSEARTGDEWGVLKVSAVSWGSFNPNANKALPYGMQAKPEYEVKAGDFLLSRANTDELVARSVVVIETPPKLMMSDKIVRFTLSDRVDKRFINIANLSNNSRTYYASNASGTSSSMKNVSREVISKLPIPLPPLAEQQRIVEKIDRLMELCDKLEGSIDLAATKQTALLDAVMAQV